MDLDVDNDGKIDRTQDSDMDGELNHIDEDDDNDGILILVYSFTMFSIRNIGYK